ncbi:MAG: hypothetical protein DRP12_01570, partial [Candidatus Aenigmatarchaeota archaeon]
QKLETDGPNFCYSIPETWTNVVFIGSLFADVMLIAFSRGALAEAAVGLTSGTFYLIATKVEKWPGK